MKVLLVIAYGDVGKGGGSSQAAVNMMKSLLHIPEIEIHVAYGCGSEGSITTWCSEHGVSYTSIYGINRYVWPKVTGLKEYVFYPVFFLLWWIHYIISVSQLRNLIKRVKPDIVHVNNSVLYCAVRAAEKENVKCLCHVREYGDFDFDLFPTKRIFEKKIQGHYTVSITDDIANHFHLNNPQKHFVVYDGVMSSNEAVYKKEKSDYFLFVGNVTKNKGVTDMVKAFIHYSEKNEKGELWLAGRCEDSYYEELLSYMKEGNCRDRIKFLGFRSDRYELMQHARAVIVPSLFEGFGFITIESIMNGAIVIGHYVSGTKMIFDAMDGNELPYICVDEMSKRMSEVMSNNPVFYEQRILKAQKLASMRYSIEENGKRLYDVYNTIHNQ